MASIYFQNRTDIYSAATPSNDGFLITYHNDGVLYQKDHLGVVTPIGGGTIVNNYQFGNSCYRYDIQFASSSIIPIDGQAIFDENDEVLRISENDADGNDISVYLDTMFNSKQIGIFWSQENNGLIDNTKSGSLYHDQCRFKVESVTCVNLPTPGSSGDPGLMTSPYNGAITGVSFSVVYAPDIDSLKNGGSSATLKTIYLDPVFIYTEADNLSSVKFTTSLFRRDNLSFVNETTDESLMAYANTYLNSSQFNFDNYFYSGQLPRIFNNESLTSDAPAGYYIFESEYNSTTLKKNAVHYLGGGQFEDKFPGWDYVAPTPSASPSQSCTCNTIQLNINKYGSYYEIPYFNSNISGSFQPDTLTETNLCFESMSLNYCVSYGPSNAFGSGPDVITSLAYSPSYHMVVYVDEEYSIIIKVLDVATLEYDNTTNTITYTKENGQVDSFQLVGGEIDFIADSNSSNIIEGGSTLDIVAGDNIEIQLTESPTGTAKYTISATESNVFEGILDLSTLPEIGSSGIDYEQPLPIKISELTGGQLTGVPVKGIVKDITEIKEIDFGGGPQDVTVKILSFVGLLDTGVFEGRENEFVSGNYEFIQMIDHTGQLTGTVGQVGSSNLYMSFSDSEIRYAYEYNIDHTIRIIDKESLDYFNDFLVEIDTLGNISEITPTLGGDLEVSSGSGSYNLNIDTVTDNSDGTVTIQVSDYDIVSGDKSNDIQLLDNNGNELTNYTVTRIDDDTYDINLTLTDLGINFSIVRVNTVTGNYDMFKDVAVEIIDNGGILQVASSLNTNNGLYFSTDYNNSANDEEYAENLANVSISTRGSLLGQQYKFVYIGFVNNLYTYQFDSDQLYNLAIPVPNNKVAKNVNDTYFRPIYTMAKFDSNFGVFELVEKTYISIQLKPTSVL